MKAPPPVAAMALAQAEAMELDPRALRQLAARLSHDRDPLFPLALGREDLRGQLDATPGDLALIVALGLVSAAAGMGSAPDDDDGDEPS